MVNVEFSPHLNLLKEEVLHADESIFQVLDELGKNPINKSYMWLYATGMYSKLIFLYEYQLPRAKKHTKDIRNRERTGISSRNYNEQSLQMDL